MAQFLAAIDNPISLAASGSNPNPRVIETVPVLLSWNEINPALLRAFAVRTKAVYRLAWLADVALSIERQKGFPGGCRKEPLERFIKIVKPPKTRAWDDLGVPSASSPKYPVWKRWRINYPVTPAQFEGRARALAELRQLGQIDRGAGRIPRARQTPLEMGPRQAPSPNRLKEEIVAVEGAPRSRGKSADDR